MTRPVHAPPDIDYSGVYLAAPYAGFSRLDLGPYKIGIAVTTESGLQDPEAAGAALVEFVRRAREALAVRVPS